MCDQQSLRSQVGDSVFYKNHQTKGKLDLKWKPYYRIIEKKGPVSYIIKNQLDGVTSNNVERPSVRAYVQVTMLQFSC